MTLTNFFFCTPMGCRKFNILQILQENTNFERKLEITMFYDSVGLAWIDQCSYIINECLFGME